MSINEDRVVWTTEQAKQAVKSFLATLESDGFYDVFADPDIDPSDLTAFRNDDIRRNDGQSAAAQEWWESVRNIATHNSARFLTLAEPLAQYGIALDELYAVIPMECNFNTLTQAFIDCGARPRGVLPLGITNTTRWTDDQLRQKLEEVKKRLDWDNTTDDARRWWEEFEDNNTNQWPLVLRLAEELANRKATIFEFYQTYRSSNTNNIQANLYYLDYMRLSFEEAILKESATIQVSKASLSPFRSFICGSCLGITNTTRWTDDQLRQKLEEVKKRLDWDNTTDDARRWWEEFENDKINPLRLVLRLAEELATRKATILEFYQSYGSSRTGNIRANLYYLDYIRLKIEHDLKRVIARPESK